MRAHHALLEEGEKDGGAEVGGDGARHRQVGARDEPPREGRRRRHDAVVCVTWARRLRWRPRNGLQIKSDVSQCLGGFLFFIRPIVLEVNPSHEYTSVLLTLQSLDLRNTFVCTSSHHITSDTCVMVFVAIEARHLLLFLLLATTGNPGRRSSINY